MYTRIHPNCHPNGNQLLKEILHYVVDYAVDGLMKNCTQYILWAMYIIWKLTHTFKSSIIKSIFGLNSKFKHPLVWWLGLLRPLKWDSLTTLFQMLTDKYGVSYKHV